MEEIFKKLDNKTLIDLAKIFKFKNQNNPNKILEEINQYLIPPFTNDKASPKYIYQQFCKYPGLLSILMLSSPTIEKIKLKIKKDISPYHLKQILVDKVVSEKLKNKPNMKKIGLFKELYDLANRDIVNVLFDLNKEQLKLFAPGIPIAPDLEKYIDPYIKLQKVLYIPIDFLSFRKEIRVLYNYSEILNWLNNVKYKAVIILPIGHKIKFCKLMIDFKINKYSIKEEGDIRYIQVKH